MTGEYNNCQLIPAHPTNFKAGRLRKIEYIIIHVTQGSTAEGAASWFACDHRPGVSSAHYTVNLDGQIIQSVYEANTAFGAPNFNANGLHIEHVGFVNKTKFPWAQLKASADLVAHLCKKYGIPKDRVHILGHNELHGNDHTDPGPLWPWKEYMALVAGNAETPIWNHVDGVTVPTTATYSLVWPKATAHCLITADDRWVIYNGNPDPKIKLMLNTKGARRLQATAYDAKNKAIAKDTLDVNVA